MILSFKPQFVEPIFKGTKIHTIRLDPESRWKKDRMIQMATGVRTKKYNMFKETPCMNIERIFITIDNGLEITVGTKYLSPEEIATLAINDGFENVESFYDWFAPIITADEDLSFAGVIIHWTPLLYNPA